MEQGAGIGLCIIPAGRSAQRVLDLACEIAGSTALHRKSPLERMRRDRIAVSSHMLHQGKTFAAAGRVLPGAEEGPSVF